MDCAEIRERLAHIRGSTRRADASLGNGNNTGIETSLRSIEHEIKMIRREMESSKWSRQPCAY